ncbi:hypothetical protein LEP1GSC168_0143, partial [Leptospira santarosai str. HAI134]
MSDVTNPHDRLIRETLQDKEDAISFLNIIYLRMF